MRLWRGFRKYMINQKQTGNLFYGLRYWNRSCGWCSIPLCSAPAGFGFIPSANFQPHLGNTICQYSTFANEPLSPEMASIPLSLAISSELVEQWGVTYISHFERRWRDSPYAAYFRRERWGGSPKSCGTISSNYTMISAMIFPEHYTLKQSRRSKEECCRRSYAQFSIEQKTVGLLRISN